MPPPKTVQRLDEHAQALWQAAHDSAVKTYGEGGRAHRVAFSALKHEYEKKGDRWVNKGWKGPSDPHAAKGYKEGKNLPTAGGKVAKTVGEAREKAKEARREAAEARRKEEKKEKAKKKD